MRSTFSRTFFPAVIIFLAALLLVGTFFQALVRDFMKDQAMDELKTDATTISDLALAYYAQGTLSQHDFLVNLSVISRVSGSDAVICSSTGKLVLCSDSPLGCEHQGMVLDDPDYLQRVITEGFVSSTGRIQNLYSDARYVVAMPISDGQQNVLGIVIVSTPMTQTLAILNRMSEIYLVVSPLVLLVSLILMNMLARHNANPLRDMARAASAFGHGQLNARVRVDERSPEEVQELALAFNNMASSLQKSEYQRQEFVANVSHELKTPMTTIGGYVDGMLYGTIPPEKHRQYMQIVSDETKRLSRLVRSMLDISRLQDEGGIPDEQKHRFDICECAGQVLITFEQKINIKGVNVQVQMPEHPVYTLANQDAITQVVYNLLDNAVKFCPAGGELGLTVREGTNKIYVSIYNDGETIPAEELPLVFDRFHKLDKSRSQNRDGWGLGLYIVKTIVGSHGEDISVSSKDGRTEFTFTLPLVN